MQNYDSEKIYNELAALPTVLKATYTLPQVLDYTQHSVEVKLEPLPVGNYIIVVSENEDCKPNKNVIAHSSIYISNISYIKKENEINVLHRNSGEPLVNAKVEVWQNNYNYDTRKYENKLAQTLTTDKNGYCKITVAKTDNASYKLIVTHNNETLDTRNSFYLNNNYYNESKKDNAFLFTDRSIYRPGQLVYFKGIVINEKSNPYSAAVVENKKTTLELYDANHQKIATQKLTTNAYGSYNGSLHCLWQGLMDNFILKIVYTIHISTFK